MATTTSSVSQVGSNYYKTSVTTNADGSLSSTTFRTDAKGGGEVPVQTTTVDKNGGNKKQTFGSGATAEEQKAFSDPNSAESKAYSQQVQSQNPYGSNPTAEQKKVVDKAAGGSGNASSGEGGADGEGGETLTAEQEKDIGTTAENTRKAFKTDLVYPITLKQDKQDILQIEMVEYRPTPIVASSASGFGSKSEQKVIGTVYLPIPSGISDSNGVSWQSDEINPLQAAGVNFATSFIKEGGEAAGQTAGQLGNTAKQNMSGIQSIITSKFVEAATGSTNILSRTKGVITNPNMELIFQGPQLRQFAFTYKLSSRSSKESEMIRSIIRFFKQGMAVQRSSANLFLKAPNTFKLTYKHKKNPHIYLNKFKECALTNFSVDYTPEGQYATFTDGAMVSYQITLQFQELEPVFNDDYGNSGNEFPDPDIGY